MFPSAASAISETDDLGRAGWLRPLSNFGGHKFFLKKISTHKLIIRKKCIFAAIKKIKYYDDIRRY